MGNPYSRCNFGQFWRNYSGVGNGMSTRPQKARPCVRTQLFVCESGNGKALGVFDWKCSGFQSLNCAFSAKTDGGKLGDRQRHQC
jgi:hypothetical protein